MDLNQKIEAVKQGTLKEATVTPCELVNSFGYSRRSWRVVEMIINHLAENELELSDDLYHAWFYATLILRHKEVATTQNTASPIKRVLSLKAAGKKPLSVSRDSDLSHAITLMQQNDYSQLPVVSGGQEDRNLCGYISWKTIGLGLWHDITGKKVRDFMSTDVVAIPRDMPLLDAIHTIAEQGFVIVLNADKTFSGIVTSSDIAKEFFSITQAEAFLLLEQIELQIRMLLDRAGLLVEDLRYICADEKRKVNCFDDLTFGEYQKIIETPKYWNKINIKCNHSDFIKLINDVREIRNDVMHFEPDGIGDKMQTLRNMARYLSELLSVKNNE